MIVHCLQNEDETLGNLIAIQLNKDPRVKFCSYEKKHPLDNEIYLTIDTDYEFKTVWNENIMRIIDILKSIENKNDF
jgi:DNA-directed RNA polymerase subunit L